MTRITEWYAENEIVSWFNWLSRRGIPCALVSRNDRRYGFSVWRVSGDGVARENWQDKYEVVREANNFSELAFG